MDKKRRYIPRYSIINQLTTGVASVSLLMSFWLIIPHVSSIPSRSLWVDELENFAKVWQENLSWFNVYSVPEWLYLFPIQFADRLPIELTVAYRYFSFFLAMYGLTFAARKIHRDLENKWILTFVLGGIGSSVLFWSYAFVARPYIYGLVGVMIISSDQNKGKLFVIGLVLSSFHAMTTLFALIFVFFEIKSAKKKCLFMAITLLEYFPMVLSLALTEEWLSTGRHFNQLLAVDLKNLNLDVFGSFIFVEGFQFKTASALLVISFVVVAKLIQKRDITTVYIPILFVIALIVLRTVGMPVLGRYIAPCLIWSWINMADVLQSTNKKWLYGMPIALMLIQNVELSNLPRFRHWETTSVELSPYENAALHDGGCHILIEGQSAAGIIIAMNDLLQLNVWLSPRNTNSQDCVVELSNPISDIYFHGMEPRFVDLFGPAYRTGVPTIIIRSTFLEPHATNVNIDGYTKRIEQGILIYTKK